MGYFAHYDRKKGIKQFLADHLISVSGIADQNFSSKVSFDGIDNVTIKILCHYINLFHDFGKYTTYFQQYLINGIISREKNHAHISACVFYNFIKEKLPHMTVPENKYQTYVLAYLGYLCIWLHHRSLTLLPFPSEKWPILHKQATNLLSQAKDIISEHAFKSDTDIEYFSIINDMEILKDNRDFFIKMPFHLRGRLKNIKWYFMLIYLFSVLIDADKLDSGGICPKLRIAVPADNVSKYLHQKRYGQSATELVEQRELARRTMLRVIDQMTDEEIKNARFFTVTAPTGLGKTLSSLQCVLKLQERIQQLEGYIPRIISAIPFINIIEQTQNDYKNVMVNQCEIVVHHRLAEIAHTSLCEDKETPLEQVFLEVESWEGDVILTTFVQLFQSLLTGNNRLLKKANKLAGSIVILDEVQSLPDKYMSLIGALLLKMAEYYGTRFILMTATQPRLLEFGDQLLSVTEESSKVLQNSAPIELLPNHDDFFNKMERTCFVSLLDRELDTEEFVSLFFEKWTQNQSALIVVNTIKRSIELFNHLRDYLTNVGHKVEVFYLSTNIMPIRRKEIIDVIKGKLGKTPLILVSTQTIEAGVDLDFDIGFRDLAPLTSLIQTAGRINREGEKGKFNPLYIVKFKKDSQYVYKLHHLDYTEKRIQQLSLISEPDYRKLVDSYYTWLVGLGVPQESHDLWEDGVLMLDFKKLNEFALIENKGEVVDVFIETREEIYESEPTRLANAYEEILRRGDRWNKDLLQDMLGQEIGKLCAKPEYYQRKALLRYVLAKMSKYTIQVRAVRAKQNRPIEFSARSGVKSQFYWIPPEQVDQYYDRDTGFRDETGKAYMF